MTNTELKNELGKILCYSCLIKDPNPAVSGIVTEIKSSLIRVLNEYHFEKEN